MTRKKSNFKVVVIVFGVCCCTLTWADSCPIPQFKVSPSVRAKISFDSNKKLYTYSYTLENRGRGQLPIATFDLLSDFAPSKILSPKMWTSDYQAKIQGDTIPGHIDWGTAGPGPDYNPSKESASSSTLTPAFYAVKPGHQLSGFSFQSANPPGLQEYFVLGEATSVPTTTPTVNDDEPEPNCPGANLEFLTGWVTGLTVGPVSSQVTSVAIRLRDSRGAWREFPWRRHFKAEMPKQIGVVVLPRNGFDPSTIDVSSVIFGPGNAPVISSKPMTKFEDRDQDKQDWEKGLLGFGKESNEESKHKSLLLVFDSSKVGIRCEIDYALFLHGKTKDGKQILGGVSFPGVPCEQNGKKEKR